MKINHLRRLLSLTSSYLISGRNVKTISLSGYRPLLDIRRTNMSGESAQRAGLPLDVVVQDLNQFANLSLAEKWDNVGLLVEPSTEKSVSKITLTNDLTEPVMEECIKSRADMIISYHPPIFTPLKRVTQATWKERIVSSCIENKIAVYSPHTSWDAVHGGVTDWLAEAFDGHIKPNGVRPLVPASYNDDPVYMSTIIAVPDCMDRLVKEQQDLSFSESTKVGDKQLRTTLCSRERAEILRSIYDISVTTTECKRKVSNIGMGRLLEVNEITLEDCANLLKTHTGVSHVRLACAKGKTKASTVRTIALVPGSGGSLLKGVKADLFVTGEMFHHDVLDANHNGASVILTNHSDSERGFLAKMAELLRDKFKDRVKIELSTTDSDPLKTV